MHVYLQWLFEGCLAPFSGRIAEGVIFLINFLLLKKQCIGKKNVLWFHIFLGLLFILMVYDAVETILVLVNDKEA